MPGVHGPGLLLFCGGMGGSEVEDAFAEALRECALDTLAEAEASGTFERLILVADEASARHLEARLPAGTVVDADTPGEPWHFGRRLAGVVRRYGLERPVYV